MVIVLYLPPVSYSPDVHESVGVPRHAAHLLLARGQLRRLHNVERLRDLKYYHLWIYITAGIRQLFVEKILYSHQISYSGITPILLFNK